MISKSKKEIRFQERLEKRILEGLICEWESALWILEPQLREKMRKPFFSLKKMKTRLGAWFPEKREISLNFDLALNHGWAAVREVLHHEMAHQLADEVLRGIEEFPHGPTFRKACHLLRANPKASGRHKPLDTRILHETEKKEDKAITKIRKLIALGKSRNPYEAQFAMAKAHELMKKHNVDRLRRRETHGFASIFLGTPRLRHHREAYCLANLLQDFYFVHGIWVSAYVLEKEKMGRVLEVSGTPQNIQTVSYVFAFVSRFIDRQWIAYKQSKEVTHHRKTDFAVGIIEGFRWKLEAQQQGQKRDDTETALIKLGDRLLAKYVLYRYPRTAQFKRAASRHSARVYEDGVAIGKRLNIARGITEKTSGKRVLIEHKIEAI